MEGGPDSVEKLEIWQDAIERVETVYALTKTWPKEELYGFTPWDNVESVLFHGPAPCNYGEPDYFMGVNPVLEDGCRRFMHHEQRNRQWMKTKIPRMKA